ncbi:arginine--tRNA ligase [Chitinophagaceae bacterium IBVUCB1]|nr:arginine--tRNA ligase [Chitinophagaceae bacterium IBVUCB1]
MTIAAQIKQIAEQALKALFPEADVAPSMITVNQTKPEFTGDYTVVLFPFVKLLRQKPDELGKQLGDYLVTNNSSLFTSYDIVSGFLNLTVQDAYWASFLTKEYNNTAFGEKPKNGKRVMVEYSSPNTNKPLHFGHLRNIFLGYAMADVLKANGYDVIKANLINDRGIHICKSMIAWMRYANGATPQSTGTKGDHLVGDYYVKFNDIYKEEIKQLMADGMEEPVAEKEAPIMKEAQDLLRKWEAGDKEVYTLWETMNGWVYEGFNESYKRLGVDFDKMYYESNTYLLGKTLVEEGLNKGVLFKKADGSVWIDLTADGLDQKLLLRSDGTSVYMTQDLGTAQLKYNDHNGLHQSIYVIADEQNYHMQVLKLILQKLGEPCADGIYHLSYGMVELPSGRMKSREGTVVDADDMMDEMISMSRQQTEEAGKTEGFAQAELDKLYYTIGMGALKFYLLRVDPKKKMIFNPKESIDLHGFTATFIQYAHARICSILRKEGLQLLPDSSLFNSFALTQAITPAEKKLAVSLEQYPTILDNAATEYNPSLLCNYCFALAQQFNSFYDEHSISKAENEEKKQLRLMLIVMTAQTMRHAMNLLGIALPEKM